MKARYGYLNQLVLGEISYYCAVVVVLVYKLRYAVQLPDPFSC